MELENNEYLIEFIAYPYTAQTWDSPAEGGDWEIIDVKYVNADKFHEAFDPVPDRIWQPLEMTYTRDLTEAIEERIIAEEE